MEGSGSPEAEAAAEGAGWGSPSLHTCEKSPIPSSPGAQQGGNVISGHPGSRKLLETPARKQACLQRNHYSLRLAAAEGSGSSPGKAQPVVSIYTQPREQRAQQQVVLGKHGLCQQELCSRQPCREPGTLCLRAVTPATAKPRAVEEGRCYNNTPRCLPGVQGDEMLPSPGWGFPNGVKGAACAPAPVAGRWQGKGIIDCFLPVIQNGLDVRPFIAVAGILTQFI